MNSQKETVERLRMEIKMLEKDALKKVIAIQKEKFDQIKRMIE